MTAPDRASPAAIAAAALTRDRLALADDAVARLYQANRGLAEHFGDAGRARCVEHCVYLVRYLAEAVRRGAPELLADCLSWVRELLAALRVPEDSLTVMAAALGEAIDARLAPLLAPVARAMLDATTANLAADPVVTPSYLDADDASAPLARAYLGALLELRRTEAARLVLAAADDGLSLHEIYLGVFARTQHEVGRLWQIGAITVAQEHYCTAATQLVMAQLYPRLFAVPRTGRRLVAACVGDELHELGARMVSDCFELAGWDSVYLGARVPRDDIAQMVSRHRPEVLVLSTTMAFHLEELAQVVELVQREVSDTVVLVGGRPFNVAPALWRTVGADGSAVDARAAVTRAESLLGGAAPTR